MKRFLNSLIVCIIFQGSIIAQTTIAIQDFESTPASPTWTITSGSGNISTSTGSGDTPANQRIRNGARSWQVGNTTATLELQDISVTGFTSVKVDIYLSSTSLTSGNGSDAGDSVSVFIALNGGIFSGIPDLTISGNNNARWGYNALLTANGVAGSYVKYQAPQGGTNTNNYSKIEITIPDGSTSVALKVISSNNDANERWNIDDISLLGTAGTTPFISVTPSTISDFSYIVGSGPSSSQSYQLSGSNLDPSDGDITVTGSTNYEVSTNNSTFSPSVNVAYTGGTLSSTTIYVRLKSGLSAGVYNGELIANSGGGATTQNVTVNGKVLPTEPTVQASDINFTDVTETSMTINWTNGNGAARIVFMRYFLPVYTLPEDGTSYPVNSIYGVLGFEINVVDYVVYKGTGSSVAVTGLSRSRLYHVAVFEYNGSDNYENYLTTGAPVASQRTTGPTFTEIIIPQYIQGSAGTNNQRVPFAYRVKISGLTPNTTYRYYNTIVIDIDGHTTNGAGNVIFAKSTGDFVRTASTSLSTPGGYGEFTTDGSGEFTGWYITEPTSNSRFTSAGTGYPQILLNDGAGGTSISTRLTMESPINVIGFGTNPFAGDGTGLRSVSGAPAKDFVFLYDNESGTGRPISGTFVESDGTTDGTYVSFYLTEVDGIAGAWGTIIPNILPNGIRRIERRLLSDASIGDGTSTSSDGLWGGIVNTVNPSGGAAPLVIPSSAAPLPVELVSFTAAAQNKKVILSWKTETEVNNYGFEIQRTAAEQSEIPDNSTIQWTKIGFVNGSGNSNSPKEYSYTDNTVTAGKYNYRLKQIDTDGQFAYSPVVEADLGLPVSYSLSQNYPNPFNPSTKIRFSLPEASRVKLTVHNILGQEVALLLDMEKDAGEHFINFDAGGLSSGIYFYKIQTPEFTGIRKMTLIR